MKSMPSNKPAGSPQDHGHIPLRRGRSRMGITIGQQYAQSVMSDSSGRQEGFNLGPSCRSAKRRLSLVSDDSSMQSSSRQSEGKSFAGPTIDGTPREKRKVSMELMKSSGVFAYSDYRLSLFNFQCLLY